MIGLMGGTFDPVHYGHLIMCEGIREEFNLEKVIFIPARIPPHKTDTKVTEAYDRLRMVKLAIADNPFFEASDIEMKRDGSSYTVDTLMAFKSYMGAKKTISNSRCRFISSN